MHAHSHTKTSAQLALEHLLIGLAIMFSGLTWAPNFVAHQVVGNAIVKSLAWAAPEEVATDTVPTSWVYKVTHLPSTVGRTVHQASYRTMLFTAKLVAGIVGWMITFFGLICFGWKEFRKGIGFLFEWIWKRSQED